MLINGVLQTGYWSQKAGVKGAMPFLQESSNGSTKEKTGRW